MTRHTINIDDFRVVPWFNPDGEKLPKNLLEVPAALYAKYVTGEIADGQALYEAVLAARNVSAPGGKAKIPPRKKNVAADGGAGFPDFGPDSV